jgi:RimJ/RimL family protein N-acetyltransferase
MDIPTIETERLILRGYGPADFDAFADMWADPDVVHFIGGRSFTREQSWQRFLARAGGWQHMGFGFFAVVEKDSGLLAGEAGFHEARRIIEPSLEGTLEAGWALMPSSQGWGYATEAMQAAIGWAGTAFADQRMTCLINVDNLASMRVAGRLGFKEFARTVYADDKVVLFQQ